MCSFLQVEYVCGSNGERLPAELMNSLDEQLIPVLHSAAPLTGGSTIILELILHVLL